MEKRFHKQFENWCEKVSIFNMWLIDIFENLAKHCFPVLYGFSSGELHQKKYITQLHDISIFLSLFYRLRWKKLMYLKIINIPLKSITNFSKNKLFILKINKIKTDIDLVESSIINKVIFCVNLCIYFIFSMELFIQWYLIIFL
jgi:hypothetical protein